jgi:hypothetical protein
MNFTLFPTSQAGLQSLTSRVDARMRDLRSTAVA